MDHPFTEQCFYSNCLSCQTDITIINLHTFVLDKVRVRELCCPLISHKLIIKSHACVVQEKTHTQKGFIGFIPLPSPPLWKFKIRCIELTSALMFKLSQTRERVFIQYPNALKMIQQNWAVPLLSNPNTLSLLLLIYFDFICNSLLEEVVAAGDRISSESHASHALCSKMVASYSFILW